MTPDIGGFPYLARGVKIAPAQSSLLASTSPWLNHAVIRELLAVWLLRRNGPDFPVEADHTLGMREAFEQVQSPAAVEALFVEERKINPRLNDWFSEGFISTYGNDDFGTYAPGTVGGIIGAQIRDHGFDITLGRDWKNLPPPASNLEYWHRRNGQTHDLEHVIVGGQFNSIGELVGYFVRLSNLHKYLSPKLASAINAYMLFSAARMIFRAMLHYPETWLKVLECIEQGIKCGLASEPVWEIKYEELLHLTPAEARVKAGIREAYDVDTVEASASFREENLALPVAAE